MPAMGDKNPSVVLPRLNTVHFISAVGSEFGRPQLARYRVEDESERIAMSDGVKLRTISGSADKRVVGRNGSVIFETQNLSDIGAWFLRLLAVVPISAGDIEEPGLVERDA